jgi:hypothetical protein
MAPLQGGTSRGAEFVALTGLNATTLASSALGVFDDPN